MKVSVTIEGLAELRRDMRAAAVEAPRAVTGALEAAGEIPLQRTRELVEPASQSGRLSRGYSVKARARFASIMNTEDYSAGAEWGRFGKWKGFNRYGEPGRFAYRAVQETQAEIAEAITDGLMEILTAYGWFREVA